MLTQAKYGEALDAAPLSAPQRAVYFANRAAAALKLQQVLLGCPDLVRHTARGADTMPYRSQSRSVSIARVWWSFLSQQHLTGKYVSQFTVTIQTTFSNVCALQWSNAAADCTAAIGIDAVYLKAYMRRATAYEQSDDLERALTDLKKVRKITRGVNRVTPDAGCQCAGVQLSLGRLKKQHHMQATPEAEPGKGLSHPGEDARRSTLQCGTSPTFRTQTSRSWSWTPATRRRWPRLQNWNRWCWSGERR